jgi:hypothetical protein
MRGPELKAGSPLIEVRLASSILLSVGIPAGNTTIEYRPER